MMQRDISSNYIKVIINSHDMIIGSICTKKTKEFKDHLLLKLNPQSLYLSDIMLAEESRGKGFGKIFLKDMITTSKYQNLYARCREDAHAIRHLLEIYNFVNIKN